MIVARGVSRRYRAHVALHPTDFELRSGELVALTGPNGAGKSTLLAILAGALAPSAGSVARSGRVGWSPQRPAVYGKLTVGENLRLFARLAATPPPELGVPDRRADELSTGQRQLLNLELAFLGAPRALLLDEPTAALDDRRRDELWRRVGEARAAGAGVVFATQYAEEAARAERVVRLEDGRAR